MYMSSVNTQLVKTQRRRLFIFNTDGRFDTNNGISLMSCDFDIKHYQSSLFDQFDIYFPSSIQASVIKRQAEFLAGRYAARMAILQISPQVKQCPIIEIGIHRAPVWPPFIIGSITHTGSKAASITKRVNRGDPSKDYIGIDVEDIIDEQVSAKIEESILTRNDREAVLASGVDANIATTLVFSAKESLFKALYPFVGEYFGFEKAEVRKVNVLCRFKVDTGSVFTVLLNNVDSFIL